MDKSCSSSSSPEEDPAPPKPNHLQYLNQLNKISHKISKPPIRKPSSSFDHQTLLLDDHHQPPPHQPPVYNINKNDFRDVVQKLTGSPAHDNKVSIPAPVPAPKPAPSSRLQRIRPPPLEHLTNRPPPLLGGTTFFAGQRPLSPLPPLPAVHAAAESPISAYMRYFQTSSAGFSPVWSQPPAPNNFLPSPTTSGSVPPPTGSSPVPFGCLPSPRSPYPVLSSPGSLFSAVNQFGFPLSPTLPVPSPRWKSH